MQFWKKFWKKNRKQTGADSDDYSQEETENYLVDISQVNMSDAYEREKYVTSLLDQIREAQEQIRVCEAEYKTVDLYLMDMEEISYIPQEDREKLNELARAVSLLERDKIRYEEKKQRMSDADFAKMERLSDDTDEGVKKLKEAESYQQAIRSDLQKLMMENLRGMAMISTVAVVCCIFLLLGMQLLLKMDVRIGYILVAGAAALALLIVYMKYTDAAKEKTTASRSLNRVILLQNRVKIRYVNNTNLLDYLYLKFGITSAGELEKLREQYQEEKEERNRMKETMQDLSFSQEQMVRLLRRYKLHDPLIWLHQADALLDPREMVEVRHALITRRQKLRKQIDFNTANAENAQKQVKDMVADYPQYAKETLRRVSDYEEKNV